MARRSLKVSWQIKLLMLLAVLAFTTERRCQGPTGTKTERVPTNPYELFTNCRLEEHRQNDGDSFRVRLPDGRVEQFRLYYVDAPESDFRTYSGGRTNRERIREQAEDLDHDPPAPGRALHHPMHA